MEFGVLSWPSQQYSAPLSVSPSSLVPSEKPVVRDVHSHLPPVRPDGSCQQFPSTSSQSPGPSVLQLDQSSNAYNHVKLFTAYSATDAPAQRSPSVVGYGELNFSDAECCELLAQTHGRLPFIVDIPQRCMACPDRARISLLSREVQLPEWCCIMS